MAVELFDEIKPDLVLMDINMDNAIPRTDGIAIAGILRNKTIPFALVFMTGYGKEHYDFKHTRHVDPQDFLRKTELLNEEGLSDKLEIAWNNHLIAIREKDEKKSQLLKTGITKKNALYVTIEELLRDADSQPKIRSCKRNIRIASILLVEKVAGENKKQVKLFMEDGNVYRVSKNLTPFLKSLNSDLLVQINGGIAVNKRKVNEVIPEDGEDFIVLSGFSEKFNNYYKLSRECPDKFTSSKLFLTRTYKKKGALDEIFNN